jgi:hypothetical protein
VAERDQQRERRPDHRREDADVEEHGARHVDLAENRQRHVRRVRRQERIAEGERAGAGRHGGEQPRDDPADRMRIEPRLDPQRARDDVLREQPDRDDQPATKPPPGRLWPRMNRWIATSTATGRSRRASTAGTSR